MDFGFIAVFTVMLSSSKRGGLGRLGWEYWDPDSLLWINNSQGKWFYDGLITQQQVFLQNSGDYHLIYPGYRQQADLFR